METITKTSEDIAEMSLEAIDAMVDAYRSRTDAERARDLALNLGIVTLSGPYYEAVPVEAIGTV